VKRGHWSTDEAKMAEAVIRCFDTVGTMIRRGLVPLEYLDVWSVAVTRTWDILSGRIQIIRTDRNNQFIGRDFEWLAGQMRQFLPRPGAT
jgi:hypothetical protein